MIRNTEKKNTTEWYVLPAKTQISLHTSFVVCYNIVAFTHAWYEWNNVESM